MVCANAHKERDEHSVQHKQRQKTASDSLKYQPDDPALRNEYLIAFRCLYPDERLTAFVRQWQPSENELTGEFFTTPDKVTISRKDSEVGDWVIYGKDGFLLNEGLVVEVVIYSLLDVSSQNRFLGDLIKSNSGRCPLGQTLNGLLGSHIPKDLLELASDVPNWLATSPVYFRIETAKLYVPEARMIYDHLIVSGQGGKVSLGIASDRDREKFDWVHEVVVQEQIWRWHGKPCLPDEDFPEISHLELPPQGALNGDYFAWDAIAFHQREDSEHRAVVCVQPLVVTNAPKTDVGDILFTEDKTSDPRALYFRFSAQMRSRYFGVWPYAEQAGEKKRDSSTQVLWKRFCLPQRLMSPLKKPAVKIVIPLMASCEDDPEEGNTAGLIAIVQESAFEQAGIAETFTCELVEVASYTNTSQGVKPDGSCYYQAGFDVILSKTCLQEYQDADKKKKKGKDPFTQISGPVGLTFDQGGRDPLIVNTMFRVSIDRRKLGDLLEDSSQPIPAGHLFCKLRFRRTIRPGYDIVAPANGNGQVLKASSRTTHPCRIGRNRIGQVPARHRSLRPDADDRTWRIDSDRPRLTLTNFRRPKYGAEFKAERFGYLFCITTRELDANARPTVQFQALYQLDDSGKLTLLQQMDDPRELNLVDNRLRGCVLEIFSTEDDFTLQGTGWWISLFSSADSKAEVSADAKVIIQAMSAAYPVSE